LNPNIPDSANQNPADFRKLPGFVFLRQQFTEPSPRLSLSLSLSLKIAAVVCHCPALFFAYFSDSMDIFQAQPTLEAVVFQKRAYKDVITDLEKCALDLLAGTVVV
jgi:hypothetical protein